MKRRKKLELEVKIRLAKEYGLNPVESEQLLWLQSWVQE